MSYTPVDQIDPALIVRLNALLDKPQEFFVYNAGEGGEYFTNRINEYSSVYGKSPLTTVNYSADINRTTIAYPDIYKLISNQLPRTVETRSDVIEALAASELITSAHLQDAEDFFQHCGLPLIRIHRIEMDLLKQHPSHFVLAQGPWHRYADALALIKIGANLDLFVKHFTLRWRMPVSDRFTHEQVRTYMQENNIETTTYLRLQLLFTPGIIDPPSSIEQVFTMSTKELFDRYMYQLSPAHDRYIKAVYAHAKACGGRFLHLGLTVKDPHYLAGKFGIEDFSGFHQGIAQWHQSNLQLLQAHGFTEFDGLGQ